MKSLKTYSNLVILIAVVILCACAVTLPPSEGWMTNYELQDDLKTQEKEGITITLNPVNDLELDQHPEYFQFNVQSWGPTWSKGANVINFWYPPKKDGYNYANTFMGMPAFFVSVKNSTGHILRMSDARIYLLVEGKDPIPAFSNFGNPEIVSMEIPLYGDKPETAQINKSAADGDGSLLDHITRREVQIIRGLKEAKEKDTKYKDYPRYPLNLVYNIAHINANAYKLINEVGREILPDFSLDGILGFPCYLESGQKAKVVFYDVTTETDDAGNPTKKTQFEFSFTSNPKYMKYNKITMSWEDNVPSSN